MKDVYNASLIHELRNPLNAVLGSIGLLKYSKAIARSPEDIETLNIASMSGEVLITLINNSLDGAKIEANKLDLDLSMSDLGATLIKSVSLYQWKALEKSVKMELFIGKQFPSKVEVDQARLT